MNKGISGIVINIATAVYLIAAGILCFVTKGFLSNFKFARGPIYSAVTQIFDGKFGQTLAVILAIIAIIGGILILLRMFGLKVPMVNLCMIILAVLWVLIIVLHDIIMPMRIKSDYGFWTFLLSIATNGLILGGILQSTEQFGG